MKKLNQSFFNQSTLIVAQELLGKILVFKNTQGIITETEAYMGFEDPASHAYKGKTPRTEIMFGEAGFSYVYLIYGMYHCLNIVTEKEGYPAAVLIRGIKLLNAKENERNKEKEDLKINKIKKNKTEFHLDGPGKLCRYLNITKEHNKINMTKSSELYVLDNDLKPSFQTTPRIGIKVGETLPWRFVVNKL